ncbi:MAG: hypothetical protein ACOC2D_02865 [Spirochaetota bacterium]
MSDRPQRHRLIHMTIRDPDCPGFDVDDMIATYTRWRVTGFSFFAAGYITTYPSKLPFMRLSPGMDTRDLTGELIEKAHKAGMIAVPMIDLGEIPIEVAREHPQWPGRTRDGGLYHKTDTIASACPNGGYVREASRAMVEELNELYDLDGMKFGGASQQMPGAVCYCENCRRRYKDELGRDLPPDDDLTTPEYQDYLLWRDRVKEQTVRYLVEMVHEVAGVPVVSNAVWQLGDGRDIRDPARSQDWVQVEVQPKYGGFTDDAPPDWARLKLATETSRYIPLLTKEPPWVVASYFLAWPWRRVAAPYPEQKLILAQLAANGAAPMVNLSGGPPAVHEDPRGFQATEEVFTFMADHPEVFDGDESAARVALVYSEGCSNLAGRIGRPRDLYVFGFHSTENLLDEAHIHYDIVSADDLPRIASDRYDVIVLPAASVMSDEAIGSLERHVKAGVGLVAWGDPARFDGDGKGRSGAPLGTLLGVESIEDGGGLIEAAGDVGRAQAYLRLAQPAGSGTGGAAALTEGLPCAYIAAAGPWWKARAVDGTAVPVVRGPAFRVFPEGLSYPESNPDDPLAILSGGDGAGKVVFMPFDAGHSFGRSAHPDAARLVTNAVGWVSRAPHVVRLPGFPDVLLSARTNGGNLYVHLINTTGRQRLLTAFTPVFDLPLEIDARVNVAAAKLVSSGEELPLDRTNGTTRVAVPRLVDYDVVELSLEG